MKTIKLFGIPVVQYGSLPDASAVPGRQTKFLSPRFEPSNISQNATVADLQNAIREAENGEPRDLFRFYRDVLLSDDHIQGEINSRKLAMLAQPLAILPRDKKNPDDVALARALMTAKEDCENWNAGLIALMDSNCGWPVSIVERLYKPAGEPRPGEPRLTYTLKKFVPVNPMLLCYRWAYLMGGVGLGQASAVQLAGLGPAGERSSTDAYTIDLERWEPFVKLWPIDNAGRIIYDTSTADYLDPARHIVHRGHLLSTMRDNWGGPMRAIGMWWLFRQLGREWFARGMERYGSPYPVGYTDATDPAAVNLLKEAFDLANKLGGLVVDESSRIELNEAMVQGMAQGYETFYNLCNDAISKHITGMSRSTAAAGLNAGEDNMQQSVREDYRVFDQMSLNETLVRQLVVPFRDLNGLKGMVRFVWGGLSDKDASTFATLLKTMKEAGFQITDDSIPTANERTGLSWERVATPDPMVSMVPGLGPAAPQERPAKATPEPEDEKQDDDEDGEKLLSARLSWLSAGAGVKSPVDDVVQKNVARLADAFRGANAPIREIILRSTSREDAERQLKLFYTDWKPERINAVLEEALQICAAKGAAANIKEPK
jgi:phage gp29-like protein